MHPTLLDRFISTPANDYSLSLMINDLENECFPPAKSNAYYNDIYNMNQNQYEVSDSSNQASSSAGFDSSQYLSQMALMPPSDSLFEPMDEYNAVPMNIPGNDNYTAMPDLTNDWNNYGMVAQDMHPVTKFPFKPSSPYYHTPTIHRDPSFFDKMLATVSPQDAMLKQDDYPIMGNYKDHQDFEFKPNPVYETPEVMDEDEDDYDEDLVSSDDELEFDDDLSVPTTTASKVPGLTFTQSQPTQPTNVQFTAPSMQFLDSSSTHDAAASTPEQRSLDFSMPTPSPSPLHSHRRTPSTDGSEANKTGSRSKRLPLSHTGPHRCDQINSVTGEACNKIFSRPYDLIRHQDTIHAAVRKTFKCDLCGDRSKTFSRMDALSRHIRVKHH